MERADVWADALEVDTSDDVHVASRADGVHVFYTERATEFVRTDHVVDVEARR